MKNLIAVLAGLAVVAPTALASGGSLKVSPKSQFSGKKVTISGSVGSGCSGTAMIYSRPFRSKQKFNGIPAVKLSVKHNKFSVKVKVVSQISRDFTVKGVCGNTQFAKVKYNVVGAY